MHYDIIVVGAGPAGLSFARALKDTHLKILLVEKQSKKQIANPAYDGRDLALTHLTRKTMRTLGTWQHIPETSVSYINEARVLDGDSPLSLDFDAPKEGNLPLGYMVSNHRIRKASYDAVAPQDNVSFVFNQSVTKVETDAGKGSVTLENGDTYTADLIVAADTRFSQTRRQMGIAADTRDFAHSAIVCRVEHDRPHDHVAWEIFQYGRTLAILPQHDNQASVVITVPSNEVEAILAMTPEEFANDVSQRFEHRLGEMRLVSELHTYPLVAVHAKSFFAQRFCVIGDASVGMHPVTAHGFNLGLRGGATLARLITRALERGDDIASYGMLRRYEMIHMRATRPLYHGTNALVQLFTNDRTPARALRKGVLHASRILPPVRWMIKRKLGENSEPFSVLNKF